MPMRRKPEIHKALHFVDSGTCLGIQVLVTELVRYHMGSSSIQFKDTSKCGITPPDGSTENHQS